MTADSKNVINLNLKKEENVLNFSDFQKQSIKFDILKLQEAYLQIIKTKKEITMLKTNSTSDIRNISRDLASNIIENITGDKLNSSSIEATIEEIAKNKMGKYL